MKVWSYRKDGFVYYTMEVKLWLDVQIKAVEENRVVGAGPDQERDEASALWDLHLDHRHPHAPAGREAGAAAAGPRALVSLRQLQLWAITAQFQPTSLFSLLQWTKHLDMY